MDYWRKFHVVCKTPKKIPMGQITNLTLKSQKAQNQKIEHR